MNSEQRKLVVDRIINMKRGLEDAKYWQQRMVNDLAAHNEHISSLESAINLHHEGIELTEEEKELWNQAEAERQKRTQEDLERNRK